MFCFLSGKMLLSQISLALHHNLEMDSSESCIYDKLQARFGQVCWHLRTGSVQLELLHLFYKKIKNKKLYIPGCAQ